MKIQGRVYRIITDDFKTGKLKVYIGSTGYPLETRLSQHKCHYELYKQKKHNYVASFEIIKEDWYEIALEQEIEFENFNELIQAERKAFDKYKADDDYIVVNINTPARTVKEYYNSPIGRESIKRYHNTEKGKVALSKANKKYYEKNRERKIAKMKENYQKKKQFLKELEESIKPAQIERTEKETQPSTSDEKQK